MGHSISATKRERQNETRRQRNITTRVSLKKELKKFEKTVRENPAKAAEALSEIQGHLDRAARKNAIPKGRADRKKARLALFILRVKAGKEVAPAKAVKAKA